MSVENMSSSTVSSQPLSCEKSFTPLSASPDTPPTTTTSRSSTPTFTSFSLHQKSRRLFGGALEFQLPESWTLDSREMCDLELLLNGGFAPLEGFMCEQTYLSVLQHMKLDSGEVWPVPIVLAIPKSAMTSNIHWQEQQQHSMTTTNGDRCKQDTTCKVILLRDCLGVVVADLFVEDVYQPRIELEMDKVLGTRDENHPYMTVLKRIKTTDCFYVGGRVKQRNSIQHFDFADIRKTPAEVKQYIQDKGWKIVLGFQTRNPMHCSHYELTRKVMQEVEDEENMLNGNNARVKAKLLVTPAVGPTQPGDIEYHIRVRCYKKVVPHYPENSVSLVLLPLAMRMAGPREAVWHAIIRRNYGCTHFIVGRDHAGPSAKKQNGESFYQPYEAHELLKSVQDELGIKPVFGKAMVYIGDRYVEADKVPPGAQPQNISGTELRQRLQTRSPIPSWYSFPSVVEELHKFYLPRHEQGFCIYFTGLPCSGKSTLASAVEAALQERETENRRITLFDADMIRTHLSKGLGFSKEDRSSNVRRIGFVASEVVKHHGICLVANIAPYEVDRRFNREIVNGTGGTYLEVHVSTPINVCEQRDIKDLYRKARQGVIKHFTGVSDPYEIPTNPELAVNSSCDIHGKIKYIMDYLKQNHYILDK